MSGALQTGDPLSTDLPARGSWIKNASGSDPRSIAAENVFHASVGAGLLLPQERLQQSTNFQKETSASLSSS